MLPGWTVTAVFPLFSGPSELYAALPLPAASLALLALPATSFGMLALKASDPLIPLKADAASG